MKTNSNSAEIKPSSPAQQLKTMLIESTNKPGYAICFDENSKFFNWVMQKLQDGRWITVRRALPEEIMRARSQVVGLKFAAGFDEPERA